MNVEEVQRRLWEQSKTHKENREESTPLFPTSTYDLRIRNLSDLIHHTGPCCSNTPSSLNLRLFYLKNRVKIRWSSRYLLLPHQNS